MIKGSIDTAMSKTNVKNYKIVLRKKLHKIAYTANSHTHKKDYTLHDSKVALSEGQSDKF